MKIASHDGETAEFALAVAGAWQGKGLGRALLERFAARRARRDIALFADIS